LKNNALKFDDFPIFVFFLPIKVKIFRLKKKK
jgi:hypothetical protein